MAPWRHTPPNTPLMSFRRLVAALVLAATKLLLQTSDVTGLLTATLSSRLAKKTPSKGDEKSVMPATFLWDAEKYPSAICSKTFVHLSKIPATDASHQRVLLYKIYTRINGPSKLQSVGLQAGHLEPVNGSFAVDSSKRPWSKWWCIRRNCRVAFPNCSETSCENGRVQRAMIARQAISMLRLAVKSKKRT